MAPLPKTRARALLLLLALCAAPAASAAVPQRLNYQGKLANAAGDPLSGTYSFRFKLFAAETGGAALFSEDFAGAANAVAVVNGIYTVQIGSVTAGGIPYGVFEGPDLYLEVDVNAGTSLVGAETLAPRERLNSAAWAVHALGAERLGTGALIATFTSAGNLLLPYGLAAGTGTFSGKTALGAGSGDLAADVSHVLKNLGTTYTARFLNNSGTEVLRVEDDGTIGFNVGIKNILTANGLELRGIVGAGLWPNGSLLELRANTSQPVLTAAYNMDTVLSPTRPGSTDGFGDVGINVNGSRALTVRNTTGNVGIGTTGPATLLDVNGAAQFGAGAAKSTFTAAPGGATYALRTSSGINVGGTGGVVAAFFTGSGAGLTGVTDDSKVAKAGDAMTGQLTLSGSTLTVQGNAFSVGGSTLVVTNGNIGIGTTAPASTLHLKANGASLRHEGDMPALLSHNSSASSIPDRRKMHIGWTGGTSFGVEQRTDSEAGLNFRYLSFDLNSGNTGVGTSATSPLAALHADGNTPFIASSAGIELIRVTGTSVTFAGGAVVMRSTAAAGAHAVLRVENNAGAELTRFQQDGRVGVGVTAPAANLHVSSANAVAADAILLVSSGTAAGQELLVVKGGGKVGIGAASPTAQLHVNAPDSAVPALRLTPPQNWAGVNFLDVPNYVKLETANSGGGVSLQGTGFNTVPSMLVRAPSGGDESIVTNGKVGIGLWDNPDARLHVHWDGTTPTTLAYSLKVTTGSPESVHVAVTTNGNVGIGTRAPATKLDVEGNASFGAGGAKSTFSATGALTFPTGYSPANPLDAANKGYVDSLTGAWTKTGAVVALATPSDNVVVQSSLTVQGNAFSVGGSTFTITGSSIGIGTNAPAAKLEVRGDLRLGGSGGGYTGFSNFGRTFTMAHGGNDTEAGTATQATVMYTVGNQLNFSPAIIGFVNAQGPWVFAGSTSRAAGEFQAGTDGRALIANGNVGIGTTGPATLLDVNGAAQFGAGAAKSTFTAAPGGAAYALSTSSGINVGGTGGVVASFFVGSGAALTGISASDNTKVAKAGDTMTGQLTVAGSSVTIVNDVATSAFSLAVTTAADRGVYHLYVSTTGQVDMGRGLFTVGGASFVVVGGGASVGATNPAFIGASLALQGRTFQVFNGAANAQVSIRAAGNAAIWSESGSGFSGRRLFFQQHFGAGNQVIWRNASEATGATNQDNILVLTSTGGVGIGVQPSARLHVSSASTSAADNLVLVSTTNGTATTNLFRVQANGNVFAHGAVTGGGADLAEMYAAQPEVEAGDVVELSPSGLLRRADESSRRVMGIISSNPGSLLGWDIHRQEMPEHRPLALAGRVPVKFSDENGPARRGDALSAASAPGFARRARAGELVIGSVLEDAGPGKVLAYVRSPDPHGRAELLELRAQNERLRRDLDELRRAVLKGREEGR